MRTRTRKTVAVLILAAAAVVLLGIAFICTGPTFRETYKDRWGIELPRGKEIYETNTTGFFGDGDRYRVISYGRSKDLSQVVAWEERLDAQAVEAMQAIWLDIAPDEAYLPLTITEPYGYYCQDRTTQDKLVMIYAEEAVLGSKTYAHVIFFAETHG